MTSPKRQTTLLERGFLINRLMVPPTVAGTKQVTRRLIPNCPPSVDLRAIESLSIDYIQNKCPLGPPGTLLWGREDHWLYFFDRTFEVSFRTGPKFNIHEAQLNAETADKLLERKTINTPTMVVGRFLPKDLARIWMLNTGVTVQRLHDITEADAILEGVEQLADNTWENYATQKGLRPIDGVECYTAYGSFSTLWARLHGVQSWDENPWVFVVSLQLLSTTGRPTNEQIQSAIQKLNL